MQNCDLISAIRLPNNLFTDIANTSVGSDLIILQKNPLKKKLSEKEQFFKEHNEWNGVNINKLFVGKGTAPVIYTDAKRTTDQFGKFIFEIKHSGGEEGITNALKGLLQQHIHSLKPVEHKIVKAKKTEINDLFSLPLNSAIAPEVIIPLKEDTHLQIGSLIFANNHIYTISEIDTYSEKSKAEYLPLDLKDKEKLRKYIDFRDTYFNLFENEAKTQIENFPLRTLLNEKYDSFVAAYGHLRTKENSAIITLDSIGLQILGLEKSVNGIFEKADIFQKPVSIRTLKETMSINEAYLSSLNEFGDFNKEFILEKTQASWEEIKSELKGRIYYDPTISAFTAVERAIGGNVYEKIDIVSQFMARDPGNTDIQEYLDALEQSKPAPIAFDVLDFNLGERWLPVSLYEEFAQELFHIPNIDIQFSQSSDEFRVKSSYSSLSISDEYCIRGTFRTYNGIKLLAHALNDTTPEITKKILVDGNEQTVPDYPKIQQANMKIESIQRKFESWMKSRPDTVKKEIEDRYNSLYNCFVKPTFNGDHLEFKDINFSALGYDDLYKSQKDAIWMQLVNGGGIVDHEVGGGKTMIMCVASYESKRLGLVNKPVISGMKGNVKDIVHCYKTAYPSAKILYIDKFDKKNRKDILLQIKNNDWDCIILSHDNLAKIPTDFHIEETILNKELSEINQVINAAS
ncbi:MAG: hypothetical protein ACRC26_04470, partial [Bacteroidales bacterium]